MELYISQDDTLALARSRSPCRVGVLALAENSITCIFTRHIVYSVDCWTVGVMKRLVVISLCM